MIPREATWGDLHVGAYMQDKSGVTWKITAEPWGDGEYEIKNRAGKTMTIKSRPADTPVTILVPEPQAEEALLVTMMGASSMGRKVNGQESWSCAPYEGGQLVDMRAHLAAFHRVLANDVDDLAELKRIHDHYHAEPSTGHTAHHHRGVS